MTALNRNEKLTCDNCGTQTTRKNIVRHKTRCSAGTFYCTQCPNILTTSQWDLKNRTAKKHATPPVKITHKCKNCFRDFSGFYALRQHKTSEHVIQLKSAELDVNNFPEDDDAELKEELQICQHFLVHSELEEGRHRVFSFTLSTFDNCLDNKKLVFEGLKCAAKNNHAFGFVLKNVEDVSCRYFYAYEGNTVMERSKLVCTPHDINNCKGKLQKMDIVDLCTRERANTKWKFYKLTNLTVFAALLKDINMGWKDSVIPEPLLKKQNVIGLSYEQNTKRPYKDNLCLVRALALKLHGNERLEEETSKFFNLFLNNCGEADPSNFQGDHMTDLPKMEDMLQFNIFVWDINFADGELIRELARRSIQKIEISVEVLRYNNHIRYVSYKNSLFKSFSCSECDTIFSKTGNLERHLITYSERVKHTYPKIVH